MENHIDGSQVTPAKGDFLDGDDAAICTPHSFGEEGSGGSSTAPATQLAGVTTNAAEDTQSHVSPIDASPALAQGPRQRRGHTKSRLGCVACKQRKIKCQETRPACANCTKRGTVCTYLNKRQRALVVSDVVSPRHLVALSDAPNVHVFCADDLQLFHHYLTAAYPSPPHESEDIWTKYVPTYSHEYPYLMHAMLGFAGSHLDVQIEQPRTGLALFHRQKAIAGLQNAFSQWPPPAHEAHVMLAASYLLAFQSGYLENGFLEHIQALRGCASLSKLVMTSGLKGPFGAQLNMRLTQNNTPRAPTANLGAQNQEKTTPVDLATQVTDAVQFDPEIAFEALQSILKFSHLTLLPSAHAIEKSLVAQFVETMSSLLGTHLQPEEPTHPRSPPPPTPNATVLPVPQTLPYRNLASSLHRLDHKPLAPKLDNIEQPSTTRSPDSHHSYHSLMSSLLLLITCPTASLLHLFSPTNRLGAVITAHFLAIRLIVSPLFAPRSTVRTPVRAMIEWTASIIAGIDADIAGLEEDEATQWSSYVEWPRKVVRCMQACAEGSRGLKFGDVRRMVIWDPGALKEGRRARV